MALFQKRKPAPRASMPQAAQSGARVKVLGTGCVNCVALSRAVQEAVAHMGIDVPIEHISDLREIASYGVMSVPALVVDGKVVSVGRALRPDEVEKFLEPLRAQ